jgi:uncharacterized membrane protein YfcA
LRWAYSARWSARAAASSSPPYSCWVYPQSSPALITAISLIAVFFNAGSGSIAYARQRRIDVVFGAQLGAVLSQRLSGAMIQRLLAIGLLVLGVRLVLSVVL